LFYTACSDLEGILESPICNPGSTTVSKSLQHVLRPSVWESYETEVESLKLQIKTRADDLIAANVKKRRMGNAAAQTLFRALVEHLGRTSVTKYSGD
jgi:hypothetical protein